MAGKTKLYPPLRLCAEKEGMIQKFESIEHVLKDRTYEEFLGLELDNALGHFEDILREQYGIAINSRRGQMMQVSMTSLLYDNVFTTLILSQWRKNKQVYCIPKEFCEILVEAEDFQIELSIFQYLPYDAFYLELEDHKYADGVLVRYNRKTMEFAFCILFKSNYEFTESGVNGGFFTQEDNGSFKEFLGRQKEQLLGRPDDEGILAIQEVLKLTLQASMYLCAKNADVKENLIQKDIYKPSAAIKNRYAEVRKWDVGERVVHDQKRAMQAAKEQQICKSGDKDRKRPRQHWRKAHWHTYWVGKGRKERELKFIAPMLINDINDEMPVVKHE